MNDKYYPTYLSLRQRRDRCVERLQELRSLDAEYSDDLKLVISTKLGDDLASLLADCETLERLVQDDKDKALCAKETCEAAQH